MGTMIFHFFTIYSTPVRRRLDPKLVKMDRRKRTSVCSLIPSSVALLLPGYFRFAVPAVFEVVHAAGQIAAGTLGGDALSLGLSHARAIAADGPAVESHTDFTAESGVAAARENHGGDEAEDEDDAHDYGPLAF